MQVSVHMCGVQIRLPVKNLDFGFENGFIMECFMVLFVQSSCCLVFKIISVLLYTIHMLYTQVMFMFGKIFQLISICLHHLLME